MKNILFLFAVLFLKTNIISAQSPMLLLDAEKGLSNTTWQDQSGNNNHITFSKPTDKNVDGVYFDGDNSAMLSKPLSLDNFTIYMRVKIETMGKTLLGNGMPSEYGLHFPGNVIYSATQRPAGVFNSTDITTNQLMVLTLTRDVAKNGDNVALFMNGEQIGTFSEHQTETFNLTNLMGEIGYLFQGWMKNVEIYNLVHTPATIKSKSSDAIADNKLPLIDKIPLESKYVELEKVASPQLRQKLQALRIEGVQKKWTFQVGVTSVANFKIKEITGALLPTSSVSSNNPRVQSSPLGALGNANVRSFDLRQLNLITPARMQAGCGSCWAFCTIAAFETAHILRNKLDVNTLNLSEQQVLNCSGAGTCSGGNKEGAMNYLKVNAASNEDSYPNTFNDKPCIAQPISQLKVENWGWVGAKPEKPTRQEMKTAIVNYGAVSTYMWANEALQLHVGTAVFNDNDRTTGGGHCVQIIGWNDDLNAWLIKNSWDTRWGNNGFAWIDYNVLDIGEYATWLVANILPSYDISANNYHYLTGDFNGDNKSDLIHLVNNNYLHTWLSRGDGTFDIKNRFPAQNGYALNNAAGYRFLVGDFNGDGKSDLFHIVNNDYSHTWLSRGDGTFDIKNRFPAQNGYAMQNIANYNFIVGDFNGDGKSDLIHIVNNDYSHVWISRGDGTFDIKNRFPAQNGYAMNNVAGYRFLAGDFNGDGKTDLFHIVNNDYSHVWLSRGDGTFDIKNRFPAQNGYAMQNVANYNFTVGDFNGDGKSDLFHIVNNDYSHVWISRGDGNFDIKNRFPAQNGYAMNNAAGYRFLSGDFNGDGKTDLFHIVNNDYSHTWISRGDGTFNIQGRFPAQNGYHMKNAGNYKFLAGKFNADGKFDVIHMVNNRYTHLWQSNGDGTFQIATEFPR